jgi:Fe-S cluster assembly protein SufD
VKTDLILIYPGEIKKRFLISTGRKRKIIILVVLKEKQRAKINILIRHLGGHSSSQVLIDGVLFNGAAISITGKVVAEAKAAKINASLQERVIFLGKRGSAELKPQLEIKNNNLHVAHAATAGPADPEEVFYLQSRGIDRKTAKRLIAKLFLQKATEEISSLKAQEKVKSYLRERLND